MMVSLPLSSPLSVTSSVNIFVSNGRLSYNTDMGAFIDSRAYIDEPNPHLVYKLDPERKIETWLLKLGRDSISPQMYDYIEETWNKQIAGDAVRKSLDGISWKTYVSSHVGFSIQYPPAWSVASEEDHGVAFASGVPESHQSIEFKHTTSSLETWFADLKMDPNVILKKESIVLAGMPALRIDTTEFARTFIAAKHQNGVFVIDTTGGRMIENGMLSTLKIPTALH